MAWVYILRCADGSLYVGHTNDLTQRERNHRDGRGGTYTAARRPVTVAYSEEHSTLAAARAREQQIKRWSGKKKEALLAGDRRLLKDLSRSHRS